jgi:hypothetical protein
MDGLRLGTIASFEAFKNAWDIICTSIQNAALRPKISSTNQRKLLSLLKMLKKKWGRMNTLSCLPPGKMRWQTQKVFIQNVCGWSEECEMDNVQFRKDHKDLQMLYQLHKHGGDNDASDNLDDPFGSNGVYGGSRERKNNENKNGKGKKCFGCGKSGHVKSNCPDKKQKTERKCFKCGEEGHIAVNCKAEEKKP